MNVGWLNALFRLSPVEERRNVTGKLGAFWDMGGDHHTGADRYIMVLASRNTLITSAVVGIAILALVIYFTHVLHIDSRILDSLGYPSLATEMGVVGLYAYLHAQIMGYVVFLLAPIYFLMFLLNVRKGDVDLFRFDEVLKYKKNRTRKQKLKRLPVFLSAFILAYICSFCSFMVLSVVVRWVPHAGLEESYIFLLSYYGLSVIGHACAAVFLYAGMIMIYGLAAGFDRYGGK